MVFSEFAYMFMHVIVFHVFLLYNIPLYYYSTILSGLLFTRIWVIISVFALEDSAAVAILPDSVANCVPCL